MCCATLFAQEATMATTQFLRTAWCDICWPLIDEQNAQQPALRMSWVVVTDVTGNRRLQMSWTADREE
jgi:hypothetical protein